MINRSETRGRDGVVVTIASRDRLPDLQRFVDDEYSNDRRNVDVDLLEWAVREIRYLRLLAKRHREMDEAS
jgi:hypothetical protein